MFYLNSRSKSLKVNLNIAKNQCFTINYRKDKKKLGKKNKKRKTEEGLEQKPTKEQQHGITFPQIKGAGIYLRSSKISRLANIFNILLHWQLAAFTTINYFRIFWASLSLKEIKMLGRNLCLLQLKKVATEI